MFGIQPENSLLRSYQKFLTKTEFKTKLIVNIGHEIFTFLAGSGSRFMLTLKAASGSGRIRNIETLPIILVLPLSDARLCGFLCQDISLFCEKNVIYISEFNNLDPELCHRIRYPGT